MVPPHDRRQRFQISFRKLRRDRLRDFLRGMCVHVVHAFLQRVHKRLHRLRMFLHVAGFGAVSRVRHIAGVGAERGHDIACALLFQRGRAWFKFDRELSQAPGKGRRRRTEIDRLVDLQIRRRVDAVFPQNVLEYHLRHTACYA